MHIPYFKTSTIPVKTARSKRREASLVSELRQWVGLVHELTQLATTEEVTNDRTEGLRVDELLWRHPFNIHIEKSHPLLNEALRPGQSDTALVGEQLTNRTHPPAAEVIDIVNRPVSLFEVKQILNRIEKILRYHDAFRRIHIYLELLVNLVAAYARQVIFLGIEEQTL